MCIYRPLEAYVLSPCVQTYVEVFASLYVYQEETPLHGAPRVNCVQFSKVHCFRENSMKTGLYTCSDSLKMSFLHVAE